ncbi:MAG TPA: ATP-binding protein [Ignavibacteria bacterium]
MAEKIFLWKLYYPYLILILISLLIFGIYSSKVYEDFYISKTEESLKYRAVLINEELTVLNFDSITSKHILEKYDKLTDTRITIIDISGKVIADSRENPSQMESHADRPEFIEALKGNIGFASRYSHTLQTNLMYVAVPFYYNNQLKAVLRTAVVIEKVNMPFSGLYPTIIYGGIAVLIIIAIFGFVISRMKSKPILEMQNAAERFARGNFSEMIYPPKNPELRILAGSLNDMAKQLDEKINIIGEQKKLQLAVLESMKEGVLAVDYDEKILLMNKTAGIILTIDETNSIGRTLQETIRIPNIQKFVKALMQSGGIEETEFEIKRETDKTLQLKGAYLTDNENKNIGVVILINDITGLRYLDTLKREFVANVSHELKTPITAIKGFVETLRDGAINQPQNAKRFLDIVYKHSERLNAIVEDLLSLSRLEEKSFEIEFESIKIRSLLKTAVDNYEFKSKEKLIEIDLDCEENLSAKINNQLIVQAVENLIDNAIKYSDIKTHIMISAFKDENKLIIKVQDEGCGIPEENFPRLFERFYRIDKSRSRDEGGTGLGLSIVKHIAQVHKGSVEVESEPGKGSTFTIILPVS